MNLYCRRCKKQTATVGLTTTATKNKRHLHKGTCKVCGVVKSQLGGSIITDAVNKVVAAGPEMHYRDFKYGKYSYLGPGTKVAERVAKGDKGVNALDNAAMYHDQIYDKYPPGPERYKADLEFLAKAKKIAADPKTSTSERFAAKAVAIPAVGVMANSNKNAKPAQRGGASSSSMSKTPIGGLGRELVEQAIFLGI